MQKETIVCYFLIVPCSSMLIFQMRVMSLFIFFYFQIVAVQMNEDDKVSEVM